MPDWANDGVFIIEWLRQQGLWAEAAERLQIQREGGYAGIDALMFLSYFFGSRTPIGIKEFSDRARDYHEQLAAVGGRHWLPTQSSMSRILAAVEAESAREFGSWLLLHAPGIVSVLQHPSVLARDAVGAGWHVFDWDPTVTTLRHRALPVFERMPDGRRRSESLAQPGYPGRKRGDVQFSRATLQHAGSGLWLGIEMAPGNGAQREAVQSAVQQVVATCKMAEIALDHAVLRMDGASGNVPAITASMKAGVHYVTRLAHYQLLKDKDITHYLNEAAWFEVPSSGSGPKRQAAELGLVMLEPAPTSLQADGSVFEPVEARVVVSRFPCAADAAEGRGAGVIIDGWHYELYGTDLSPAAWPEAEIVTGYYGRSGQENRFYQEDRELGLDRIFSYNLPGQQLATAIGLFTWNFQICRGMDLARPPEALPEQPRAKGGPLTQTTRFPEDAADGTAATDKICSGAASSVPAAVEEKAEPSQSSVTVNTMSRPAVNDATKDQPEQPRAKGEPLTETLRLPEDAADGMAAKDKICSSAASASPVPSSAVIEKKVEPSQSSVTVSTMSRPAVDGATKGLLREALAAVNWGQVLEKHAGWSWFADTGGLQCPAKAVLPLIRVEQVKGHPIRARFQADWGTCGSCELRGICIRSVNPSYRKDMRLPIPPPDDQVLRQTWLRFIQEQRTPRSPPTHPAPVMPQHKKGSKVAPAHTRSVWRLKPLSWRPIELPTELPKFAVAPPILLPAALRKLTKSATRELEVHVAVTSPPAFPKLCPVLAPSVAERQKRRLTWAERLLWNQPAEGTRVEIRLLGAGVLRKVLGTAAKLAKSA
ncbi:MAG: hypothetical protein A3K18_15135 [Lentisphaerae bacterium RIFOXYA12_64_32]|nr:MAG: hypothetical protein A3K18_15135 [Lentisphaerae bacterium RIFOXYA12_64_32]